MPLLPFQAVDKQFSSKKGDFQSLGMYIACALRKLICISTIQNSYNESFDAIFCHLSKWLHQLSIIRAYALQFTRAVTTQALQSVWEVCTYLKIASNINQGPLSDKNW